MLHTPKEREHRGKTSGMHILWQKGTHRNIEADTIKLKKINNYLGVSNS